MLSPDDLYNISNGIHFSFARVNRKATLTVKHDKNKRNTMYHLYDRALRTMDRNDYIILCLFVMFKYRPSSVNRMIDYLNYYDVEGYDNFKKAILDPYYDLAKDLKYYFNEIDDLENINVLLEQYFNRNIKFYSLYVIWRMMGFKMSESISDNELLKSLYCLFKFLDTPTDAWIEKVINGTR